VHEVTITKAILPQKLVDLVEKMDQILKKKKNYFFIDLNFLYTVEYHDTKNLNIIIKKM